MSRLCGTFVAKKLLINFSICTWPSVSLRVEITLKRYSERTGRGKRKETLEVSTEVIIEVALESVNC